MNDLRFVILALALCSLMLLAGCGTTLKPPEQTQSAALADSVDARQQVESFFSDFDRFLADNVDAQGRLDYGVLKRDPRAINALYTTVAAISPDSHPEAFPTEAHRLAWWINAYNAATIYAVVQAYPIETVLEVRPASIFTVIDKRGGFFAGQRLVFGGEAISLYKLENDVIRKRFIDPRYHFAVNCASIGCPILPAEAFLPDTLDAQLERETLAFLKRAQNYRIDHDAQVIRLSSIYGWYDKDYLKWLEEVRGFDDPELLDYVTLYLEEAEAAKLAQVRDTYALEFIDYDWGLNDR
ncbi:MAG: DUF547 domain-containing protein [Opitutales bacterium]